MGRESPPIASPVRYAPCSPMTCVPRRLHTALHDCIARRADALCDLVGIAGIGQVTGQLEHPARLLGAEVRYRTDVGSIGCATTPVRRQQTRQALSEQPGAQVHVRRGSSK